MAINFDFNKKLTNYADDYGDYWEHMGEKPKSKKRLKKPSSKKKKSKLGSKK